MYTDDAISYQFILDTIAKRHALIREYDRPDDDFGLDSLAYWQQKLDALRTKRFGAFTGDVV